jgi:DNA-binding beta-propeller fold protein YncE
VLGGQIFVVGGLTTSPAARRYGSHQAPQASASGSAFGTSGTVLSVNEETAAVRVAGLLPTPIAHAASAVVNGNGYLVGGTDAARAMPSVVALRLVRARAALPGSVTGSRRGRAEVGGGTRSAPWLAPAHGPGHLARGSRPSALPADVLIADHLNNRLVVIDPHGRVRWVFPRPGDLAPGQTFKVPDDAFFSPDGRYIVATQEDDQVISVIDVATRKIVYRYGRPGIPGLRPGLLDNPDDAMLLPNGDIIAADIKNCRIIVIAPPAHRPLRVIGHTSNACGHDPPRHFGSPNGAFPMSNGGYMVTEINGDWASAMSLNGRVHWSANPPGVYYPSDTNEVSPGRYLTADYSNPGQVVEFNSAGKLLWRFGGLNQPSLALPMPNGYVLVNDDFNHRVIVINPANNRIVWQYGHTGVAGRSPGYLNDPDGIDLVPPDSFLIRHAATMGQP